MLEEVCFVGMRVDACLWSLVVTHTTYGSASCRDDYIAVVDTVLMRVSYRIKPHEQLVTVSLTHYCASTSVLSTSWSRTTL